MYFSLYKRSFLVLFKFLIAHVLSLLVILSISATLKASTSPHISHSNNQSIPSQPNIIYFLCDDLGIGELGCYGQSKIETPHIDTLAQSGMLFKNHYSGSTVCAPSRCSVLTGTHTGHTFVRGNRECSPQEGQLAIPLKTQTIAKILKNHGYATACLGKWGLGGTTTSGAPLKQGFDHFFGYICQRQAHSYYPAYLWNDNQKILLNGGTEISGHQTLAPNLDPKDIESYRQYVGTDWSPDLITKDMLQWIDQHKNTPFFLYYATPLPHVALQLPLERLAYYHKKLGEEEPYLAQAGYLPNRYPRAAYAAMVQKIDQDLGVLIKKLKELGLYDNTIIIFSSDNGPTFNGGTQSSWFHSALNSKGLKCSLYEGGIRVPLIISYPHHITPQSTSNHICAAWDILPTLCEITKTPIPENTDGISFLPSLFGDPQQKQHDYFYWENTEGATTIQAIRQGNYKLLRFLPRGKIELYNLLNDPEEKINLVQKEPQIVEVLIKKIDNVRSRSKEFPLPHSFEK